MGRAKLRSEHFPSGGRRRHGGGRRPRASSTSRSATRSARSASAASTSSRRSTCRRSARAIEHDPQFPNRTNVSFWCPTGPAAIRARIFERGVGETQSSGTGACGAAVAFALRGGDSPVTVQLDGGELEVDVDESLHVDLTGWAVPVYRGALSDELLSEPAVERGDQRLRVERAGVARAVDEERRRAGDAAGDGRSRRRPARARACVPASSSARIRSASSPSAAAAPSDVLEPEPPAQAVERVVHRPERALRRRGLARLRGALGVGMDSCAAGSGGTRTAARPPSRSRTRLQDRLRGGAERALEVAVHDELERRVRRGRRRGRPGRAAG